MIVLLWNVAKFVTVISLVNEVFSLVPEKREAEEDVPL